MNKTFSYILGFLTAIAICKGPQMWETFSELPTRNQLYWLFWIALFLLLFFLGFIGMIKNKKEEDIPVTTLEYFQKLQSIVMQKEEIWVKGVANTSILLLSACAFYAFMPNENHQEALNIPIFILALTSLTNIFFATLLPLSNYFALSSDYHPRHLVNKFFYELNSQISTYWHLIHFFACIIQTMSISYIIININL